MVGHSADGTQGWLNWFARHRDSGAAVGTVQATMASEEGQTCAWIAWIVAVPHQGRGYAGEAAAAMSAWLRQNGVSVLIAHVHPDHRASIGVARRVGLAPTNVMVDGEVRWTG